MKRLKRILQTAEVTEGHHHFVKWSALVLLRAARTSKSQTVWVMRLTNQLGQQKVKTPQASWGGAEGSCQRAWPNNIALCFTWLLPVPRLFVVTTKKEADVESQKPAQWCYLAARKKRVHRFECVCHPLTFAASLNTTLRNNYASFKITAQVLLILVKTPRQNKCCFALSASSSGLHVLGTKHQKSTPAGCAAAHAHW